MSSAVPPDARIYPYTIGRSGTGALYYHDSFYIHREKALDDSLVPMFVMKPVDIGRYFASPEGEIKHGTSNRDSLIVDTEMDAKVTPTSDNQGIVPEENSLPLRARATTATALGAAVGHAKLLAEQEEKELKYLMADIIEAEMKKVQGKIKHFEELKSVMEKEYAQMDEHKELIVSE